MYLAFNLHFNYTKELMHFADVSHGIELIFLIPILLTGWILFVRNKNFRLIGIGLTGLFFSFFIFFFFFLNEHFKTEGEFKSFKLSHANWTDSGFLLKVTFNGSNHSIKVSQEKCLNVDSVQIRIAKGFWGIGILTSDVRIKEKFNCYSSSIQMDKDHFTLGHQFAESRCSTAAIAEYTKCIIQDSTNPDPYYHRGLMFMIRNNYESALVDFVGAAYRRYQQLDNESVKFSNKQDMTSFMNKLINQLDHHEYKALEKNILKFKAYDDFDTYKTYIDYCLEKLKEK